MLAEEIAATQRTVRTDAYQMSIGEVVNMYEAHDIVIDPEFQRLFRWTIGQKSKLIESILLGIPLPSIFVYETADGKWELIDGLQRLSTILEFMGRLRKDDGSLMVPSVLEATKYLPSLHNVVWETTSAITDPPETDQRPLDKSYQFAVRRARIGVEILKRPSDNKTKFDLFQRLNAGGTQANVQELRNCIVLMVNSAYFRAVREAANNPSFREVAAVSDEQAERQRHIELAMRFLVHVKVPYDATMDVEEYIDDGIVQLANAGAGPEEQMLIKNTFDLLNSAAGAYALKRYDGSRHVGKVGLVGLEGIAVGVGKNLSAISALSNPSEFVKERLREFWQQDEVESFNTLGLRGTTRIQRTVPFGERWFRP